MKIQCTAEEQKILIPILATNMMCPFEHSEKKVECYGEWDGCIDCVSKNVEWEIEDGEQQC